MTTVRELIATLQDAVQHPDRLVEDVQLFQHAVWEAPDRENPADRRVWGTLEEVAYDLARFVPDPEIRGQDPAYYGPRTALRHVERALQRLDRLSTA